MSKIEMIEAVMAQLNKLVEEIKLEGKSHYPDKDIFNYDEAIQYLGTTKEKLINAIYSKQIRPIMIDGKSYLKKAEVRVIGNFLDKRKKGTLKLSDFELYA